MKRDTSSNELFKLADEDEYAEADVFGTLSTDKNNCTNEALGTGIVRFCPYGKMLSVIGSERRCVDPSPPTVSFTSGPGSVYAGYDATYQVSVTDQNNDVTGVAWSADCGGTFSVSTPPPGSNIYTATFHTPLVEQNTGCTITARATDGTNRVGTGSTYLGLFSHNPHNLSLKLTNQPGDFICNLTHEKCCDENNWCYVEAHWIDSAGDIPASESSVQWTVYNVRDAYKCISNQNYPKVITYYQKGYDSELAFQMNGNNHQCVVALTIIDAKGQWTSSNIYLCWNKNMGAYYGFQGQACPPSDAYPP